MWAGYAVLHTSVLPEPFGRVIVEGMMVCRPVIAAANGAPLEVLGDGYKYLVKPGNPIALTAAVGQVLNAVSAEIDALVGSSYSRASSLFSTRRMISERDKAVEQAQRGQRCDSLQQ
jgi:glycosyltransferase involved in cell wall biosynthesis